MVKQFISAAALLICATATAQQYSIGHTSENMRDSFRGNRKVPVEIYYPVDTLASEGGRDDQGIMKFPVICFAHGYLLSGTSYQNLVEMLVPEGYIMAFLSSGDGLFPSHRRFGEDLRFLSSEVGQFGSDPASPLYGMIDTLRCIMGHSMGGGALFAAANLQEGTDAIVALAPMNTKPSAIQAAASVDVPTLIFGGENDCITPPGKYQIPIYIFSASYDKTFIQIRGGTHCAMADSSRICTLAEKFSGCNEGISAPEQHQILKEYLIPWLNYFLKGETESGSLFNMTLTGDTRVEYMRSRPLQGGSERQSP